MRQVKQVKSKLSIRKRHLGLSSDERVKGKQLVKCILAAVEKINSSDNKKLMKKKCFPLIKLLLAKHIDY